MKLDLPYLVHKNNSDGSKTYWYENTVRQKEMKFYGDAQREWDLKNKDCSCVLHRSKK
jgi:hypothetical protein